MKQKGFTLIELLAVIVILSVIALIATPLVLNAIEDARKGAAIESINGIVSAAETKYMRGMLTGTTITKYEFPESSLEYKGTEPETGILVIDKNGNISITAKIDGYCIRKRFNENTPSIIDDQDCTIEDSELECAYLYREPKLNGADPIIKDNLIAVKIADDGTVTKADIKEEWYSYENKEWANAVILKDENITYAENAIIPEENIESYFVWIPRYRYQLFYEENYSSVINSKPTESNAKTVNIVFENKNTEASKGSASGEWLTHPVFTFGDEELNGIWVGKYETGYDGATSKAEAQVSSSDSSKIVIKPNTYIWRSNKVSNIFISSFNYNRNLDSHMMKNTEWGAVAYLSRSVYGINDEININNNSNFMTGYSAVEGTNQAKYPGTYGTTDDITLPYNSSTGYKASTTGNISGVYDMSGGSHEYMAAYMSNTLGSSGFNSTTVKEYDSKYFDVYASSTITSYANKKLGDATGEIGPFYYYSDSDSGTRYHNGWDAGLSQFIQSSASWVNRGGRFNSGVLSSQFNFSCHTGGASELLGSRIVLVG